MATRIINISKDQSNDLTLLQNLLQQAGATSGCMACCSGFNAQFFIEGSDSGSSAASIETFGVDNNGNLTKKK